MDGTKRLELARWAMEFALKNGSDQVAASVAKRKSTSIEFREKKLERIKESTSNSFSLRIYAKNRYSAHTTCDLRKESLAGFIKKGIDDTMFLAEDEYRSLPDPVYYPRDHDYSKDPLKRLDLFYHELTTANRVELAARIEESARSMDDRIISVSSGYADVFFETILMHSNGFTGESRGTAFSAGSTVTVKDKDGARPEASYWAGTIFHGELPDPETLGRCATERALRKIGQKKIESGKYDMLVENRACGRLVSTILGPMSGHSLQQKSSCFEGMADKQIVSSLFTLTDDPFIEKGLGSRLFDGEGLAAKKRVMIENGVLRHYYINDYYGRKLGMEPTSGSTTNLIYECGTKSPEEMIKEMKKGIFITGFLGGNSNELTGDFSFGITGMSIKDGEIASPVNEMNISGNNREFWNHLTEMGNDPYPFTSNRVPSMLFKDVDFSGI